MPRQVVFDFRDLASAVVRNNVGVDSIALLVRARFDGDHAVLAGTDQRLPLDGAAPAAPAGPWVWFDVHGADDWSAARLAVVRTAPEPSPR